jgi:hypothetical protein
MWIELLGIENLLLSAKEELHNCRNWAVKKIVVTALFASICLGGLVVGCTGVCKFTPSGEAIATNSVTVAQGLLHALDGFYGDMLTLKLASDYTTEATRALSITDAAAAALKQIIAGASVTDEQLNVVAGQVSGAQAIINQVTK